MTNNTLHKQGKSVVNTLYLSIIGVEMFEKTTVERFTLL